MEVKKRLYGEVVVEWKRGGCIGTGHREMWKEIPGLGKGRVVWGLGRHELSMTRNTNSVSLQGHRKYHRHYHQRVCEAGDARPCKGGLGIRTLFQGKPFLS